MRRVAFSISLLAFALAACTRQSSQLAESPAPATAFGTQNDDANARVDFTPLTYASLDPFVLMPRP